jgi:4-hydroxybutyrate CoA-transferase
MPESRPEPTKEQQAAANSLFSGSGGLTVLAAMSPQQPTALIAAVIQAAQHRDVALTLLFADLEGSFAFLDPSCRRGLAEGRLRLVPLAGAISRDWSDASDHFPNSLWDIDRMLRQGELHPDVVLLQAGQGDTPNRLSFGDMVGYTASALAGDAIVVAEVVPEQGCPDAPTFPLSRADHLLQGPPSTPRRSATVQLSAEQSAIGRHVAALVPDEATLQLGLGSVAEAVLTNLDGKRDLGIHSGIVTPSLGRLIASGVVTGRAKSEDRGRIVATGIYGADTAQANVTRQSVTLRPLSQTHDPATLARQRQLWAINSALEVDLSGQVNAEYVQGRRVASGGGQSDFVRAAHLSEGGASVIALPSRTAKGTSRIVARLPERHSATSAAQDIDYVVTEFGAACLCGRTVRERAEALIGVAHPEVRDPLRRQFAEGLSG